MLLRSSLLSVGVILAMATLARAADLDITGEYRGPEDKKATLTITKKGDVYLLHWKGSDGSEYNGVGILQGETLSASYHLKGGAARNGGVAVYEFEKTKGGALKMNGKYADFPSDGKMYPENWIRPK